MVEWRPLIVSIFFALGIYFVSLLANQNGSYLAVLLGGVAIAYMIDANIKDGAIHGAILGLIIGLVTIIIQIIYIVLIGFSAFLGTILTDPNLIIGLVLIIVIGLIGGILGALINSESLVSAEPEK
ncbi:MAG: hypothetical protein FGO69_09160 [Methanobacterium sp.]|nr:MAG: hypothetical protein FGO69_09160 [Methanobacterium sp.]